MASTLRPDYLEVRYEDLVYQPAQTLARLAVFLAHDLDYDRIKQVSVGSVKNPLTSFKEELQQGDFKPAGRWKNRFPPDRLVLFESLVGEYLTQMGYGLSGSAERSHSAPVKRMRRVYLTYYEFKQWAKIKTPLSRLLVDYSSVLLDK